MSVLVHLVQRPLSLVYFYIILRITINWFIKSKQLDNFTISHGSLSVCFDVDRQNTFSEHLCVDQQVNFAPPIQPLLNTFLPSTLRSSPLQPLLPLPLLGLLPQCPLPPSAAPHPFILCTHSFEAIKMEFECVATIHKYAAWWQAEAAKNKQHF